MLEPVAQHLTNARRATLWNKYCKRAACANLYLARSDLLRIANRLVAVRRSPLKNLVACPWRAIDRALVSHLLREALGPSRKLILNNAPLSPVLPHFQFLATKVMQAFWLESRVRMVPVPSFPNVSGGLLPNEFHGMLRVQAGPETDRSNKLFRCRGGDIMTKKPSNRRLLSHCIRHLVPVRAIHSGHNATLWERGSVVVSSCVGPILMARQRACHDVVFFTVGRLPSLGAAAA